MPKKAMLSSQWALEIFLKSAKICLKNKINIKKKVIVYSAPTCVYCRMAKDFLTDKNIPFTEYDLSKDIPKREEVIKKTGQMAVPVIEVDGETMIGFDESQLSKMLGI